MWTPRRIFIALATFIAFVVGYLGYAQGLGHLDGLPPLPDSFLAGATPPVDSSPMGPTNSLERKFELAFGLGCPELSANYPIKLDLEGRGILIAAQKFEIQKDADPRPGWVKMTLLSLGMVGKKRGAEGVPEINTLYCDFAFLRFDKPIRSMSDMSGSKIVLAELYADTEAPAFDKRQGRIRGQNNRRTLDRNDDIEFVTPGPVYYDSEPAATRPHIYTFTTVQITDHLNTGLPVPDREATRQPTVTGVGLRVFLSPEEKKAPTTGTGRLPIPRKDPKPGLSGVDVVELDNSVEMNLWTDANASFVAPANGEAVKAKNAVAEAKVEPKPKAPVAKRLLTVTTKGPFRYDLRTELARFERPAERKPGLVERVTVSRQGRLSGHDVLDCEYMDVQFQRRRPVPGAVVAKEPTPTAPAKAGAGDGDLEIKSIHAWGDIVAVNSDSENLNATGVDMTHDAIAKTTVLKGNAEHRVRALKDGNQLEGEELHLFGDGKEISQAHVLGVGSLGMGEVDPETGTYLKTASWTDRLVYSKQFEQGRPPLDVLTFLAKDGTKAVFDDRSGPETQRIEAHQLKVWLVGQDAKKDKEKPKTNVVANKSPKEKEDATKSAKPVRVEATGDVKTQSPDAVIRRADYLNIWFKDVPQLIKPPEPKDGKLPEVNPDNPAVGPPPRPLDKEAAPAPKDGKIEPKMIDPKSPNAKAPPKEPKRPLYIVARTIESWVNRDPQGRNELDRVHAEGDVDVQQAAAKAGDPPTHVAGQTVDMKTFAEGSKLVVTGDGSNPDAPKWGMVKNDRLTIFGFDIDIDQRTNTANVKGDGSMEMISASDLEGKKLEQPQPMTIHWKHKMEFLGTEKVAYYHGAVQAYQKSNQLKCEWMQVVLDRPVYLNQAMKPKGPKKEDDSVKIDTILCFHAPKDDEVPAPRTLQPVLAIEKEEIDGRIIKFQSVQAPEIVSVNTPKEAKKTQHVMTATSSDLMPGTVRIWQVGKKDGAGGKNDGKGPATPPRKKGEIGEDEEMKLTVVQFGEKMRAEDYRKRAKFWSNVRVLHLPADRPNLPVDLRSGVIPKGAIFMECRDTLEVFTTVQKEVREGKLTDVNYQEMIGRGNVRVRKQGEFFGEADMVTYSEMKGTLTFHGTETSPAVVNKQRGQGIPAKPYEGRIIKYYTEKKVFEVDGAMQLSD